MMTKFFAAANTENGFYSLFDEMFSSEDFKRIYILKGGPGTGKSTLMGSVGFAAEANGYDVEYIYCSSDTKSLDGVIIPALGIAVLDGTAPHTVDPIYPGAVERIVNLGEAFDNAALEGKREDLISLICAKSDAYRTAYRFLAAAGRMERERDDLLTSVFLSGKASAAAKRIVSSLRYAEKGKERRRYLSAIGVQGLVTLETYAEKAKKIYAVTGKNGLDFAFMTKLHEALSREGIAMTVCAAPLVATHTEAIFVDGEDVLFTVANEKQAERSDKIINCARFASAERLSQRRKRLRFAEKCTDILMEGALSALADAGTLHGKVENIYGACVDFSKVDEMKNRILAEIFANNM